MEIAVDALTRKFQWQTPGDENESLDSAFHVRDEKGCINRNSELAQLTKAVMDVLPNRKEYGGILKNENYQHELVEILTNVFFNVHGCWRDSRRAYLRNWVDLETYWKDIADAIEELDWRERMKLTP